MATNVENTIQYVLKLKDEFTGALAGASTKAKAFSTNLIEGINVGAVAFNNLANVASQTADIMQGDYSKIGDLFRMIPGPVGQAAGSIAAFAGSSIEHLLAVTDKFDKLSQKTGASIEFVSSFTEAADDVRVSAEAVESGLVKFSRALGGVVSAEDGMVLGGKTLVETLKSLGIEAENSNGKLKSMEEILPLVANVFQQMPDGAQKTALAIQLFGRNGAELIPILSKGADEIKRMRDESEKLGTTVTHLDKEAMNSLKNQQDKVNDNLKATEMQLARGLIPAVGNLTQGYAILTGLTVDNNRESLIFNRTLQQISATFLFWTGQLKEAEPAVNMWADAYTDSMDRVEKKAIEFRDILAPTFKTSAEYTEGNQYKQMYGDLNHVAEAAKNAATEQEKLAQKAADAQIKLQGVVGTLKSAMTGVGADIKPLQQVQEALTLATTGEFGKFGQEKAAQAIGAAIDKNKLSAAEGAQLMAELLTGATPIEEAFRRAEGAAGDAYKKFEETLYLARATRRAVALELAGGNIQAGEDRIDRAGGAIGGQTGPGGQIEALRQSVELKPINLKFEAFGLDPIKSAIQNIPSEKTVTIKFKGVSEGGRTEAEQQWLEDEARRGARAAAAAGAPR